MHRYRFVAVIAMMALALGTGFSFAQGGRGLRGGPGGGGGIGLPVERLNLTQPQQDLVRDIRQRHVEELRQIETTLRAARDAHERAVGAIPLDEAAIRSTAHALAEARADAAVLQARVRNEIFNVLTAEQQNQMQQAQAERQKRAQEGQRRRQRP